MMPRDQRWDTTESVPYSSEGDTWVSLAAGERYIEAFRAAGGTGRLIEVHGITGEGHALFGWTDKWTDGVADYLKSLGLAP